MRTVGKILIALLILLAAGLLLLQLIPYGRNHDNPPVISEPVWDSPQTVALVDQACSDCHSNKTVWPWYSSVAPVSWLVQRDVDEGRRALNFSTWGRGGEGEEAEELAEVILSGEMPPRVYLITHPEARLTDSEKQQLIRGLQASAGNGAARGAGGDFTSGERGEAEEHEDEDDD